jgi:hypothetical protein
MSLELLVQHPLYKQLLKFTSLVESREKLLRLLQYFVRFLRYWRFKSVLSPEFVNILPSLQASFTLARKPLRCLKPINHLKLFSICISDELSDSIMRYGEALKQFGLFSFFTFDAIQWIKLLGLFNIHNKKINNKFIKNINKYAAGMWCIGLIGGLIKNLRQIQVLLIRYYYNNKNINNLKQRNDNIDDKLPTMSIKKIQRDFIKNILDFVIALNLYKDLGINDGIIGGFGTITSIINLQDLWNSSKV